MTRPICKPQPAVLALYYFAAILISLLVVPSQAEDRYCITVVADHQHVISGVKRIVIPFRVINHDDNFEKGFRASVTPVNARTSVHRIGTNSSINDGDIQIANYELWLEGATASDSSVTYKVSFDAHQECGASSLQYLVTVYPASLRNSSVINTMLDKRLIIGSRFTVEAEPYSKGQIPETAFFTNVKTIALDTQSNTARGLWIHIPCLNASTQTVAVKISWQYNVVGTQHSETVDIYTDSSNNVYHDFPKIITANRISDVFDEKSLGTVIREIEVVRPMSDCKSQFSSNDISSSVYVDPPTAGPFRISSLLVGSSEDDRYHIRLRLIPIRDTSSRGQLPTDVKYPGGIIDITLRSKLVLKNKHGDASETFGLNIPPVRLETGKNGRSLPYWQSHTLGHYDDIKGKLAAYELNGQQLESLRARIYRIRSQPVTPTLPLERMTQRDPLMVHRIHEFAKGSRNIASVVKQLLDDGYDSIDVFSPDCKIIIDYAFNLQQYKNQPLVDANAAAVIIEAATKAKSMRVLGLVAIDNVPNVSAPKVLIHAFKDEYRFADQLSTVQTFSHQGQSNGNLSQYLANLVQSGVLRDVTEISDP